MYKVQTKTQSTRARQARLGFTVLVIATIFATCFFLTQAVMTAVYGYPHQLEANGSAYIGAGAAAALVKPIDNYVQNIKGEICPTLKNITAEAQCMNL